MRPRVESKDGIDNPFVHLPKALAEFEEAPRLIQERFKPYHHLIKTDHTFLENKAKQRIINGIRHDVRKIPLGSEESFEFYSESEVQGATKRTHIVLRTDKGYNKIETVEDISDKFNSQEEFIERVQTEFKLRRGVYMAQEVKPIPGLSGEHFYQRLVFDNLALDIAKLTWVMEGKEEPILTVTPDKEILVFDSTSKTRDLKTGQRTFVTPYGTLNLPDSDEFMAEAIQKILRFEPIRILE